MNLIKGDAARAFRCAKYIHDRYAAKKYQVQTLVDPNTNTVVVQISNVSRGFCSGAKKWVGLKTCATMKITPCEGGLRLEVGDGEWIAKTTDICVGMFIFGFLAVTGTIGVFKQRGLLKRVHEDALEFFASDLQPVPIAVRSEQKEKEPIEATAATVV